jgi:hypothetical protein
MRWNPTLFYLEYTPQAFIVGLTWLRGTGAAGEATWNLRIHFGAHAVRIERGI